MQCSFLTPSQTERDRLEVGATKIISGAWWFENFMNVCKKVNKSFIVVPEVISGVIECFAKPKYVFQSYFSFRTEAFFSVISCLESTIERWRDQFGWFENFDEKFGSTNQRGEIERGLECVNGQRCETPNRFGFLAFHRRTGNFNWGSRVWRQYPEGFLNTGR